MRQAAVLILSDTIAPTCDRTTPAVQQSAAQSQNADKNRRAKGVDGGDVSWLTLHTV